MGNLISFFARNWGVLLLIFGLGGTVAVVSVVPKDIPGQETIHSFTQDQPDSVKLRVVSATEVE